MNIVNEFKSSSIESYYEKVKDRKAEIAVLTWMPDSKYSNIIIKKSSSDDKLILDDTESSIWRLIFDNFSNIEQVIDSAKKDGIEPEITVGILKSFIDEGVVVTRSKNIWEEEEV